MSASGLEVFDHTLQQTHIWLNEIGETLGPERQRCYHALRAVLHALRDRLTVDEAAHLSAQLPMLIRGIYYEGYRPAGKPRTIRSEEEFLAAVQANLHGIAPMNAEDAAHAVFGVLEHYLDPGEIAQIIAVLPKDLRKLFPSTRLQS